MSVLLSYHDSDGEFVDRYLVPKLRAAGINTSTYEDDSHAAQQMRSPVQSYEAPFTVKDCK